MTAAKLENENFMLVSLSVLLALEVVESSYPSEVKVLEGHKRKSSYKIPPPHMYMNISSLPKEWNWANVNGTSYLTKNLNQHIPQYCGSCWAHGAMSSLADRIKIARKGHGIEINLSVQYILNCGRKIAGSCHGGSATGAFEFVKLAGQVPYDTCQPYIACSEESKEGFCAHVDTTCSRQNVCKTCSTFVSNGGKCKEINYYPNASIAEYGEVAGEEKMMAEIYTRGPIACGIDAEPILNYVGGIFVDHRMKDKDINHIVEVTGWGEKDGQKYWIIRNSWGEYWGEMGFARIARGRDDLGLEEECAWATPKTWTEINYPCWEDGDNCATKKYYNDPFWDILQSSL
mmetsp:Transcript_18886/g.36508  ORF Transcript_18886/g.36508 Transcript_18886/m.36508 type:complete len:345 (+) Transcript_18886:1247-2281(+)